MTGEVHALKTGVSFDVNIIKIIALIKLFRENKEILVLFIFLFVE